MKLHTHSTLSPLYTGTWYFSYIMDYCLTIKARESYIDIRLTDLTRNEECELTPISTNVAYLAFRMDSSWGEFEAPRLSSPGIRRHSGGGMGYRPIFPLR